MATKGTVPFLVAMMLLTGVCNTLLTKWQDMTCVRNCSSSKPHNRHYFEQPVLQTLQMFIGEMGCWLVVGGIALYERYISKRAGYEAIESSASSDTAAVTGADEENGVADPTKPSSASHNRKPLTGWRVLFLATPAICDLTATTLMNVGLLFVAASIYQMTRGALVLFVGLFSVIFLKRTLGPAKWMALFVVVTGVAIVGLAGAITRDEKATPKSLSLDAIDMLRFAKREAEAAATPEALRAVIGVLLIAGAQILTATQFILEESIMENYELGPLQVVGWEGIFGFSVTLIAMGILHATIGRTDAGQYGYFDAREGFREFFGIPVIAISSVLIMISIGGFNFFGISVTRSVSATSRSTIDTCRTLFIWVVSLGLGWETFKWLQVLGFALLVYGTFLFNELIRPPMRMCVGREKRGAEGEGEREREPLLQEQTGEHR